MTIASNPAAEARTPVLVASDVRFYREVLVDTLRRHDGIRVVGVVENPAELPSAIAETAPASLLIDFQMRGSRAASRSVAQLHPSVRIVAFAVTEDLDEVVSCASSGIAAYVPRSGTMEDLVRAVLGVGRGELYCSPSMAAALFRRAGETHDGSRRISTEPLTRRESEIVELIAQNLSNKQIAWRLRISTATVKNHVHNIFRKRQVSGRGEMLAQSISVR